MELSPEQMPTRICTHRASDAQKADSAKSECHDPGDAATIFITSANNFPLVAMALPP